MIEDEEEFLKHFTNRYNKVQASIRDFKMKMAVNMRSVDAGKMSWSPKFKLLIIAIRLWKKGCKMEERLQHQ